MILAIAVIVMIRLLGIFIAGNLKDCSAFQLVPMSFERRTATQTIRIFLPDAPVR